jgi:hypothetical protein
MIELTVKENQDLPRAEIAALVSKAWPHQVFYRGKSVFGSIYGYDHPGDDSRDIVAAVKETELLPDENQECYLGYLPSEDAFIVGFDAWKDDDHPFGWRGEDDGPSYGVFKVKVHADGTMGTVAALEAYGCQHFYQDSVYKRLRASYTDLIDCRLD